MRNINSVPFNQTNLRKILSLTRLAGCGFNISDVTVKNVSFDGMRYPEGVVPLKVYKDDAFDLRELNDLYRVLETIWPYKLLVQIGAKNQRPCLFIYQGDC